MRKAAAMLPMTGECLARLPALLHRCLGIEKKTPKESETKLDL